MHYLKKPIFCIITAIFLLLPFAVAAGEKELLTVKMGPPIQYKSEDGKTFIAKYGFLSDGSLHFVKLNMPNGQEYTLPQVMSGSGVRYTDDREIVWWTHQGTVRVDVRDAEGKWTTKYSELTEVQGRK